MKTLGIKFEVAGVKEAQAGLNSLKNSLNQSLATNKQAALESLRTNAARFGSEDSYPKAAAATYPKRAAGTNVSK